MNMITETHVYNLAGAVVASGLPMCINYAPTDFHNDAQFVTKIVQDNGIEKTTEYTAMQADIAESNLRRAKGLSTASPGTGHNNFLKGVLVTANVTASVKWWTQAERYHFLDIVSSMSTMHRLRSMLENSTAEFTGTTHDAVVKAFLSLPHMNMSDEELAMSCPMGLRLTAQIATNYLQLKTIYFQRRHHKLQEWQVFCDWIQTLPLAGSLITKKKGSDE